MSIDKMLCERANYCIFYGHGFCHVHSNNASSTGPKNAQTEMHVVGERAFLIPKTPSMRFEMDKDSTSAGFGIGHTGDPDLWAVQMTRESLSPDLLVMMVGGGVMETHISLVIQKRDSPRSNT